MKAPYDSTISSIHGHTISAVANQTVHVPDVVEREALMRGWQPSTKPEPVVEAPAELSDNVTEQSSDGVLSDFQVELDQAVLVVIQRADPQDFKADGNPKLNSVINEMSPDVKKRPTAGQVAKSFEKMQDYINLVD
jgi:hypothetical protein